MDVPLSYDSVLFSHRFALEPIDNILNSLSLLNEAENPIGLHAWVTQTAATLTLQQRERNRLIFGLLRNSLTPGPEVSDFPSYLKHLAARDPYQVATEMQRHIDKYQGEYYPDTGLQREIDALLNDPPTAWHLVVSHLEELWETKLATEWRQVQPSLTWQVEMFTHGLPPEYKQMTVETALRNCHAFDDEWDPPEHPTEAERQFIAKMLTAARFTFLEQAFRYVTGREMPDHLFTSESLDGVNEFIFVPSWHTGRAVCLRYENATSLKLFFSEPPNYDLAAQASALIGGEELRARLNALGHETNQRILALLAHHPELHAQEIGENLQLNPSNVSRHLRQLASLGYLSECRRQEASKTYRLSSFYVARTARALQQAFLGESEENWTLVQNNEDFYETLSEDLGHFLDQSGRLILWPPARRRDKLLLLEYLASFFEQGRVYSEQEVNELLLLHSAGKDYTTLRRALCDYRFLRRTRDGSQLILE